MSYETGKGIFGIEAARPYHVFAQAVAAGLNQVAATGQQHLTAPAGTNWLKAAVGSTNYVPITASSSSQITNIVATPPSIRQQIQHALDFIGMQDSIESLASRPDVFDTWYRKFGMPGEGKPEFLARLTSGSSQAHANFYPGTSVNPPNPTPVVNETSRDDGNGCQCGLHKVSPGAKIGHSSWCPVATEGDL